MVVLRLIYVSISRYGFKYIYIIIITASHTNPASILTFERTFSPQLRLNVIESTGEISHPQLTHPKLLKEIALTLHSDK